MFMMASRMNTLADLNFVYLFIYVHDLAGAHMLSSLHLLA